MPAVWLIWALAVSGDMVPINSSPQFATQQACLAQLAAMTEAKQLVFFAGTIAICAPQPAVR